jgi:pimeloyl-ACP methyl ester carboxylesterase
MRGGDVAERMIEVNGVELCTEPFGEPTAPPLLLIMGLGGSMLWWEERFCGMLAAGGRFVVRYDHRDTGRSTAYAPGRPGYRGVDLVADAARVLDAYGLPAAHVVGVSAGGAFAQLLALDFADRVLSLVLISTSPATPGDRELPPPTGEFTRFLTAAHVDWSNRESVIDYVVAYSRVLAGGQRPFDEATIHDLVRRDVERARNISSLQNHDVIPPDDERHQPLSSIKAPTLVIHGTADPLFPLAHGRALADEIAGATLLALDRAGHGVDRADWNTIVPAIVEHTAPGAPPSQPRSAEPRTESRTSELPAGARVTHRRQHERGPDTSAKTPTNRERRRLYRVWEGALPGRCSRTVSMGGVRCRFRARRLRLRGWMRSPWPSNARRPA